MDTKKHCDLCFSFHQQHQVWYDFSPNMLICSGNKTKIFWSPGNTRARCLEAPFLVRFLLVFRGCSLVTAATTISTMDSVNNFNKTTRVFDNLRLPPGWKMTSWLVFHDNRILYKCLESLQSEAHRSCVCTGESWHHVMRELPLYNNSGRN